MAKTQSSCLVITLFALFLSSCQGVSQEVIDSAMKWHNERCAYIGYEECKNAKVVRTERLGLTEADKANKIDAFWCVQIDFIYSERGFWLDSADTVRIISRSGTIEAAIGDNLPPFNKNTKEGKQFAWEQCTTR